MFLARRLSRRGATGEENGHQPRADVAKGIAGASAGSRKRRWPRPSAGNAKRHGKRPKRLRRNTDFSLDEITGVESRNRPARKIKYRNPDNPAQTWSGRGRKPAWVHEALARGLDITDLEA
ncbi:H-NS family nucleoid-associated regulatory protein [Jhaorihella thermophila]